MIVIVNDSNSLLNMSNSKYNSSSCSSSSSSSSSAKHLKRVGQRSPAKKGLFSLYTSILFIENNIYYLLLYNNKITIFSIHVVYMYMYMYIYTHM